MTVAAHTERAFEAAIESGLTGTGGYGKRSADAFDEALALFPADVTGFLKDSQPAGGTWKTHYLWDEVLEADSVLEILRRFMHLEVKERKVRTDKGARTARTETMIFPRYHQLDSVRKLVAHAKANGAGRNYLIQHSAGVWYRRKRDRPATDHRTMNAVLDAVVQRFKDRGEDEREEFRGQLTAYRNLYGFLSQIIPYRDTDLERLYAFVRNLLAKLPLPGDGRAFVLDDEVALRFYRLQQVHEGSIGLAEGEPEPLKGPTDVGTARAKDEEVALSSLIDRLNERFGTDFAEADQLFFDQIRASAEKDEEITEAARANSFADFAAYLDRVLDELFIARMEGNEGIFDRVMTDTEFRSIAHRHLAREIFRQAREERAGE